jgi:transcription initiation factor TFIIIB Brf1 subunit/transcription initiation factor TFIIB
MHSRGPDPDRALLAAFGAIGQLCHLMGLPQIIKDAASETFKLVADKKAVRGRSARAVHAACIYIACRQEGIERTFREVCGAAAGTTVKEIGRVYKAIIAALEHATETMAQKGVNDERVVARLANTLALPPEFTRAAREIIRAFRGLMAELLVGLDAKTRKQPGSIATAGLWLALQLHGGAAASIGDLSRASSMVPDTIETASRWMFPHVRALTANVASDFRRPEAIRRIEAAYPIDASMNSLEAKAAEICAERELGASPEVAAAAQAMLVALQSGGAAAARQAAAAAGAKRSALAAAAVWLALRLRGGATTLVAITAASGAAADETRVAARALFPHARELVAALQPPFRSEEALARVEAEHPRLLWIGTAAALAPAVAAAAAAAAGAGAHAPGAEAAAAAAGALDATRGGAGVVGVAPDAAAAATAAAAALLLARLAGCGAPALAACAAAAHVDATAVAAVARGAFPHARALAAQLPAGTPVTETGLAALETDYPPPAGAPPAAPADGDGLLAARRAPAAGAPTFWISDLGSGDIF